MEAGQWSGRPGYRPPMAAGQQYPALGYAPDGSARFGYQPETEPTIQPEPVPTAPSPEPPPPSNTPQRTAIGVAAVIVLVLAVVGGLQLMSGGDDGDDDLPTRAAPPASQNIDDPYLPKSITPTETVPGEETRERPRTGVTAQVVVEGAPGTMILYTDNGRARLERMTTDRWEKEVGASTGLISVNVVPADGAPASCTITVDGQTVARDQSAAGSDSGIVVCRVTG